MEQDTEFRALIDYEVEKRRQVLIRLLDECCDFYRKKYENILTDVLNTKSAEDVNFSSDVSSKVAPIAEKKVAAQLRSAMRLETEFREIQSSETDVTPNTVPQSQQPSFTSDGLSTGTNSSCPRNSPSGAVPKSRTNRRIQPYSFSSPTSTSLDMNHLALLENEMNSETKRCPTRNIFSPERVRVKLESDDFLLESQYEADERDLGERESTVEFGRRDAVDLTCSHTHLIVAEKQPPALTFMPWDDLDPVNIGASNAPSPSSTTALRSVALEATPEVVKYLDKDCVIVGMWQDNIQYMFQLSYVQYDLDSGQLRSHPVLSAPGIICVATLPHPSSPLAMAGISNPTGRKGHFFAIQTSGTLNVFSNFQSEREISQCFDPDVYDAAAVNESDEVTFIAACFEHNSFVQIVSLSPQGRNVDKFQLLPVNKPKRVFMPTSQTLLVGCYPGPSSRHGVVLVLNRTSTGPSAKFSISRKVLDGKGLGNIWGLAMGRNLLIVLHRRGSKAKLTKLALNL